MIRPVTPDDESAVLAVAVASGVFAPDDVSELGSVFNDCMRGIKGAGHTWIADDNAGLISIAYYAPELMTKGTWNLYLIAVRSDRQGQGHGTALLRYVEQTLTASGERLLLVETSGLPDFERTRAFYRKLGFEEEARIRDFYEAGDDKIVFRKLLTGRD